MSAVWALVAALCVGVAVGWFSGWLLSVGWRGRSAESRHRAARADVEQRLADKVGGHRGGRLAADVQERLYPGRAGKDEETPDA